MDCREVEELAGAFALRAVPEGEAAVLRAHLAGCPETHQLVGELLEVVDLLPLVVEEREPPAGMRDRLLAAARAPEPVVAAPDWFVRAATAGEAPDVLLVSQTAVDAEPTPISLDERRSRRWWSSSGILAAAAMLVIAVGIGLWGLDQRRQLDDRSASLAQQEQVLAAVASGGQVIPLSGGAGVHASLVRPVSGGTAYVVGSMPAVPAGKAYEAWIIRGGKPVAAGVFRPAVGYTVVSLQGDLAGAQAVAFTVESDKGVDAPSTPVVARASVS